MKKDIKNISVAVLAGGLGTRMKSGEPKALSALLENPLIFYGVEALINTRKAFNVYRGYKHRVIINKIGIVIGHKGELVKNYILKEKRFKAKGVLFDFAEQKKYLGTGDAALKALDMFTSKDDESSLLILPCDMPLIETKTFEDLIKFHLDNENDLTVLSVKAENPYSYGRILKDKKGYVKEIIEENELVNYPENVREIKEINSGVYVVKLNHLKRLIKKIKPDNLKKEYYFTDIVNIFFEDGLKTMCYNSFNKDEFIGVNSKPDLLDAQKMLQKRVLRRLMDNGVNLISADNVYIGYNVNIGQNATIYPNVFISGNTHISNDVIVENGCIIKESYIAGKTEIKSYSVLEEAFVMDGARIGPFARLRPGSLILEGGKIGNFVEVKKSIIGKNTKASHLSYIGDAVIGDDVNIGAGVITCNYDGIKKYETIIEDGCFIGSDSQLVAPVKIGKNSYVGSGTTITKDVPEGSLAISRMPQRNIMGWALKKMKKRKKAKKQDGV
ncbi:MAG: bifunctional UDP-N-acetylglucosamine diphosphorylase/glucosamine-1-phosphate N-acetyltransferase GlmU [Deltaproteobacteria bacterium]|jgi:bifunctional UDP-N-acetylglucosamine pyrophosphorylase/glucosamine-1-phosphate N-acetyltransferase|nr:bifunctional UDP-N-acetylglucosamine diphosphorylase/glucosamine-1-phosphate N-acetyltransferase GlmU [Deltaproteobacteria bacterium]MCL5879696.1 bifunctional UDP-N-acetylglucosamine diphosphorylase/glucosamine-1-phosphate N-acetyltransferase GlmU [Deltaproteobacteria bacterium]MDA8304125.1 bifunctional UDP-N-acetylglucosamine diphosphorylase/glucosamine-1-phosphate N-acetyltransferase GlmU [Deltaproteobacteria bacterium]